MTYAPSALAHEIRRNVTLQIAVFRKVILLHQTTVDAFRRRESVAFGYHSFKSVNGAD
jgi:hypothetical protein